jgi:stress response protein SCP2
MRQFIRGERAKLSDLAAINHIWEVGVSIDAPFYIVDFCCLGLDARGEVVDDRYLISYNRPDAPNGAIRMDNTSNNGAIFTINLGRLPAEVRRVVFTATLHKPEMPGGIIGAAFNFFGVGIEGDIGEGHLTLSTPAIDTGVFAFSGDNFGEDSTLVLGEIYWRDEWRFVAAGQPPKGELGAFLRTLTDGPLPVPPPVPPPSTPASIAAPPRPPRVAPRPVTTATPPPILRPAAPSAPVTRARTTTSAPPSAPVQPVAQSVSATPPAQETQRPVQAVAPVVKAPPAAASVIPRVIPVGGNLQELIDAAAPGSTLTLIRDEYEGPVVIGKPLVLEGRDSAVWSKNGPVVTITVPGVTLQNLDIEVTVAHDDPTEKGVALLIEGETPQLQLNSVRVSGRVSGLGDEDGQWTLPSMLDLGEFAARSVNEFHFALSVPTSVRLSSPVEGVVLTPGEVEAGEHRITLQVRDVPADSLIPPRLSVEL